MFFILKKGPVYTKKEAEMQCYSINGEMTINRLQTCNAQKQNTLRESEGIIFLFVNTVNLNHFNNSIYIDNLNNFDYSYKLKILES